MSSVRAQGVRLAVAQREQYIRALQHSLPHRASSSFRDGALHGLQRQRLQAVAAELPLPKDWLRSASHALRLSCEHIVARDTLERCDLFLCALIHPSLIRAGADARARGPLHVPQLRREVAMPLEASMAGACVLRLLRSAATAQDGAQDRQRRDTLDGVERNAQPSSAGASSTPGIAERTSSEATPSHHRHRPLTVASVAPLSLPPPLDTAHLLAVPRAAGLEEFVLYDKTLFLVDGQPASTPPDEVLLASVTALCGAIDLCEGAQATARFLDRMLARARV